MHLIHLLPCRYSRLSLYIITATTEVGSITLDMLKAKIFAPEIVAQVPMIPLVVVLLKSLGLSFMISLRPVVIFISITSIMSFVLEDPA